MEDFGARQQIVSHIRGRVAPLAGGWLTDVECVQIAISCKVAAPMDLLGLMFPRNVASVLKPHTATLAITDQEWSGLFSNDVSHAHTAEASRILRSPLLQSETHLLQTALRSTIVEATPKIAWQRPVSRVAVYVGMHFVNHEDTISAVLGGVVGSDSRRLDDLRAAMDERGVETMELSSMIAALGAAAC